jgi:hypothetical protein
LRAASKQAPCFHRPGGLVGGTTCVQFAPSNSQVWLLAVPIETAEVQPP